jgi:hypothetical protein
LQASKLLNKLGNKLQEKASKMLDEGRTGSTDLRYDASGSTMSAYSSCSSTAAGYAGPGTYGSAAPKSADALDKGDIKRVVAAADGSMWAGYKRGVLEKYTEAGQLLWSSATAATAAAAAAGSAGVFRPAGITALAAVGSSVWVGDTQGRLWVLDASSAALQRSWKAHVFPVRSIAAGGHLVYSLGKAGSIRAWPALAAPAALTAAWQQDLTECMKEQQLTVSSAAVHVLLWQGNLRLHSCKLVTSSVSCTSPSMAHVHCYILSSGHLRSVNSNMHSCESYACFADCSACRCCCRCWWAPGTSTR